MQKAKHERTAIMGTNYVISVVNKDGVRNKMFTGTHDGWSYVDDCVRTILKAKEDKEDLQKTLGLDEPDDGNYCCDAIGEFDFAKNQFVGATYTRNGRKVLWSFDLNNPPFSTFKEFEKWKEFNYWAAKLSKTLFFVAMLSNGAVIKTDKKPEGNFFGQLKFEYNGKKYEISYHGDEYNLYG